MSENTVEQLVVSLKTLHRAIVDAEEKMESSYKPSPATLERLKNYKKICIQQLEIANQIDDEISSGDWSNVNRQVKLINGLAELVKEDAKEVLGEQQAKRRSSGAVIC